MARETTLIIFKPDAMAKKLVGTVLARFQAEGFRIRGAKMMVLHDELLAEHYAHLTGHPVFPALCDFMKETPVIVMALAGDRAIERVRELLGPTDSTLAEPGTVRGDFGHKDQDSKMRNVCHASDSPETARTELARFFSPNELF